MSSFGVLNTGFNLKTLQDLLTEVEQEQRNQFGPDFNTQADSVAGILNGIFLDKVSELWEVAQAVYRSRQPDSANGESLDNVAAITGAIRLAASPSVVTLFLNIDDTVTVTLGSIVQIGTAGARWVIQAAITNSTGAQTTLSVLANSEDSAPIVGNAFSIDTIATPIAGWVAKAAIESLGAEPFNLADLQTLLIKVDEATAQTIIFNTANFADITAATAAEIAAEIDGDTTGLTAIDANGKVRIVSDVDGSGSALEITGGTGNPALGFNFEKFRGFNPDRSAKILSGSSEGYDLNDADTLFVKVDQGSTQTVTFNNGDFGTEAGGTITAIAASLLAVGVDTDTFILDDGVNPAVTFIFDDDGTVVEDPTTRAINHTGIQTDTVMRDRIVTAINAAPTLNISALPDATALVVLENDNTGVAGNVTITETVVDGGFIVTGMAGGVDAFPTGSLTVIAASLLAVGVDTDTFILDDGTNPAVTFVFDDDSSVVQTPTLRAINHTGVETATAIRDVTITAIAGAPSLDITASIGGASIVTLTHDNIGTSGNVAVVETVANAGFLVSGMTGGIDATAIEVCQVINEDITGGAVYEVAGKVQIESFVEGANSRIEITGGTANTELGFEESEETAGTTGDAILGRDIETDSDFRIRREDLLRISGAATIEAIRSAILNVIGVLQAFVFGNPTDFVDGFGRPPHSVELVVAQGVATNFEIATVLFLTKAAGIETFKVLGPSGVSVIITDTQGIFHTINYSKATEIQMFVEVDVSVNQATYGGGSQVAGDQQVKEAIRDLGDALQIGEDVIINKFLCAPFPPTGVAGVVDVTSIKIEDTFPPTNTANIVIADRDLAAFSTADIVVNVTFV